jgi:hypothetical protein
MALYFRFVLLKVTNIQRIFILYFFDTFLNFLKEDERLQEVQHLQRILLQPVRGGLIQLPRDQSVTVARAMRI